MLSFSNVVDYGMNIQAALESPSFTKRNTGGCDVSIESRAGAITLQQLSERGHEIRIRREYTQEMGRGQAVLHNSLTKTNYAASDPRADGSAVPDPIQSSLTGSARNQRSENHAELDGRTVRRLLNTLLDRHEKSVLGPREAEVDVRHDCRTSSDRRLMIQPGAHCEPRLWDPGVANRRAKIVVAASKLAGTSSRH